MRNNFDSVKALFIFVTLLLILPGCGVKEGAEFYALQKQHNQLSDTVSNLQAQVDELIAENSRLRVELETNSQAVDFLIQDQKQAEMTIVKLQNQMAKDQKETKQ